MDFGWEMAVFKKARPLKGGFLSGLGKGDSFKGLANGIRDFFRLSLFYPHKAEH